MALGIDRLIMWLCGTDNIQDVIALQKMKFNYGFFSSINFNSQNYNMERFILHVYSIFFSFAVAKTVWREKWIRPF
ncbi:MAG: hypothetical protein CM1200mP28_03440 [Deltaproteobacteria bacterium]|nr:MAG: hypothetical protein CM1200mP28_03440 [Deltaproteobacteria bacterium]